MKKSLLTVVSCAFLAAAACTTDSTQTKISENLSFSEDENYREEYRKATKHAEVYINFETRFIVSATHLSPQFSTALASRTKELFGNVPFSLDKATGKTGFFVSVFSPEPDKLDLADSQLWNIEYKQADTVHKPLAVKKIRDKIKWRVFFPEINTWTVEYLVIFDSPAVSPNLDQMVAKDTFRLFLANSDAKVKMTW